MTSKLVVNTIEADTGISSVSFASSISMSSTSKFHFGNAGIDIGADTNINRPSAGVLGFNINSSEKVRIQSNGRVGISTNNPVSALHVLGTTHALGNGGASLIWGDSVYLGALTFDGSAQPVIRTASSKDLVFQVNQSTEALRIKSDGKLLLGTTDTGFSGSYTQMTIGNTSTSNTGLTIASSPSNGFSRLHFADGNSGTATYAGFIAYSHADNALLIGTNSSGTEKLRIDSSGRLLLGTTTAGESGADELTIENLSSDMGITLRTATNRQGTIMFSDSTSGVGQYAGAIQYSHNAHAGADSMKFFTNSTQKMRIHKEGYLTKPYQVAFFAHCNIGDHDLVAGSKFQFNVVTSTGKATVDSSHTTFNGTNVFNASTNTFTAPVAGLYHFTVSVYFRRTGDPLTTLVPRVNNTEVTNGNNTVFFVSSNDITDGNQQCGSLTLQLAANDAVTVHRRTGNSGTTRFYGPHSHFCGHLIG